MGKVSFPNILDIPKQVTLHRLNKLFGELARFLTIENIASLDEKDLDRLRKSVLKFNSLVKKMLIATGGEITKQISARHRKLSPLEKALQKQVTEAFSSKKRVAVPELLRQHRSDALTSILFVQHFTASYLAHVERQNGLLSQKNVDQEALAHELASQFRDLAVFMSAFGGYDGANDVKILEDALKTKDPDALLQHTRTLFDDLSQSAQKLSKTFPDLNNLVSAMNALLPKPLAGDTEGSISVADAMKTFFVVTSIFGLFYIVTYWIGRMLWEQGNPGLIRFFIYTIPLYPSRTELDIQIFQDMARTFAVVDAILIGIVLLSQYFRKK